jgi:hypothetical protein
MAGRVTQLLMVACAAACFGAPISANAGQKVIGDILACYACQNSGNTAIDAALAANPSVASDGLLLAFVNTSGLAITGGTFSENGTPNDSFTFPTIAANSTFILMPGLTSDGGSHPSGGLFADTGITADTSDGAGGLSDTTAFLFTGTQGGEPVTSGQFTPSESYLPWRSPAGGSTSFIGQGPNGDGGCSNCYFGQIATLTVQTGAVPEPSTWALMMIGFAGIGYVGYRASRKSVALVA